MQSRPYLKETIHMLEAADHIICELLHRQTFCIAEWQQARLQWTGSAICFRNVANK
jgi:hypothetical protein